MTTSQNLVDGLDRNQSRVQLPVISGVTVNEGDLVYWDTTLTGGQPANTLRPVTAKSQITTSSNYVTSFAGMALQSSDNLVYPGDSQPFGVLVLCRGVAWFNTTASDVYGWFTPVTVGADSQTITSSGAVATSGTTYNLVGYTLPPVGTSARVQQATPQPETVTGGAGVRIQVQLVPVTNYAAAV